MAETGKLLVHAYVSTAQIPIAGAVIIVSAPQADGKQKLLFVQHTDENGNAGPVVLAAPDRQSSIAPGQDGPAFSAYTLVVEHPDYQLAVFEGLQVFPNIETLQEVPMIPLSANLEQNDVTTVTPQPL